MIQIGVKRKREIPLKNLLRPFVIAAHTEYNKLPLFFARTPRAFHAYCVGTNKSGTHSIANIFSRCYNARHEPEHYFLIDRILAAANGKIDQKAMARYLINRDKRLWLELESSLLTNLLVDILVTEFKQAKFILTIRDCYSWLDSAINSELNRPVTYSWQKWLDFAFKAKQLKHSQAEKILAEHGLYTLDQCH